MKTVVFYRKYPSQDNFFCYIDYPLSSLKFPTHEHLKELVTRQFFYSGEVPTIKGRLSFDSGEVRGMYLDSDYERLYFFYKCDGLESFKPRHIQCPNSDEKLIEKQEFTKDGYLSVLSQFNGDSKAMNDNYYEKLLLQILSFAGKYHYGIFKEHCRNCGINVNAKETDKNWYVFKRCIFLRQSTKPVDLFSVPLLAKQ